MTASARLAARPETAPGGPQTGVLRYRLDWRDAMAWERPGLGWSQGRTRTVGATFFGLGALYALGRDAMPAGLSDLQLRLGFIGLGLACWMALRLIDLRAARARARTRLPSPLDRALEIGPGLLREQPTGMTLTPASIDEMRATRHQAYFRQGGHLLVLPARAFGSPAAYRGFVQAWAAAVGAPRL